MRCLFTGTDDKGRSCVIEERDVSTDAHPVPGVSTALLYATSEAPPPARPHSEEPTIDVLLPPGHVRWMMVEHAPATEQDAHSSTGAMHNSDTLDFVHILDGTIDYLLGDGVHELGAGDCLISPGIDHAVQPGPAGCRMLVVSVGTPPPR
jgi:quercetin dioxygenase-like cupin family protein